MRGLITWILDSLRSLLVSIGVPATVSTDFLVNVFAGLLTAVLIAAITLVVRSALISLQVRLRRYSREAISPEEIRLQREYLNWLMDKAKRMGQQWHDTPIESVIPSIPIEARKRQLPWSTRINRWTKTMIRRARLFRYSPLDYVRVPFLADMELSMRASFGKRTRIRDLAKELRRYTKIVVLGDPGSGKSVCLRQLAYDLSERELLSHVAPARLPVFLDMGAYDTWQDRSAREPSNVLGFVQDYLRSDPSLRYAPTTHSLLHVSDHLETLLKAGKVVFLFDALDEMPQDSYQERYRALIGFMTYWEKYGNRFVYSCRTLDYDQSFRVDEVIIEPFDRRRIRAFLRRHVGETWGPLYERIVEDESLEEMVGIPFFLQALAFINKPEASHAVTVPPRVPETRAKLIREFVDKLLHREAREKQAERLESIAGGLETLFSFLSELAFGLQNRREGGTSVATSELQHVWNRYPDWENLLLVATRARILGKRGLEDVSSSTGAALNSSLPNRIEFVHHRVGEFFAAAHLAHYEDSQSVDAHLEDIWWQETVILAIGIVDDPRQLLSRLLAQRADTNEWHHDSVHLATLEEPEVTEEELSDYTEEELGD